MSAPIVLCPASRCLSRARHAVVLWRQVCGAVLLAGAAVAQAAAPEPAEVGTIAFGSCLHQERPQPVWDAVLPLRPDLFVFAGDNVYADSGDPAVLAAAYDRLAAAPGFQALRTAVPLLATWDDHDYGLNDGGAEFPGKTASRAAFLAFFRGEPAGDTDDRGIFQASVFGPPGRRVQVILLDTRWYRGPLRREAPSPRCMRGCLVPNSDPGATLLGEAQWQWLDQQLRQPAELRLLLSSIQVIPEEHGFEKWANFPHERERLFRLIRETGADGVVILSGDRHLAELSRLPAEVVGYPLVEVTSSSLNTGRHGPVEPNRHRIGGDSFRADNFGVVRVDWAAPDPHVALEVRDVQGKVVLTEQLGLGTLRRGP